jgi:hypothetical protein
MNTTPFISVPPFSDILIVTTKSEKVPEGLPLFTLKGILLDMDIYICHNFFTITIVFRKKEEEL